MDSRPLLEPSPSPPSAQATPSSSVAPAPAQYEAPPSELALASSRSASAPNLSPPAPPPSSPRASSSPASASSSPSPASASSHPRAPSSPLRSPSDSIQIKGTAADSSAIRSDDALLAAPNVSQASATALSSPVIATGVVFTGVGVVFPSARICSPSAILVAASPNSIRIEGTSSATRSEEVQTAEATVSDEDPTQDRTLRLPHSTSATTSAPALLPSAVTDPSGSTLRRFLRPRNPTLPVIRPEPVRQSCLTRFKQWYESLQGNLLPDGLIQTRVAVCGFAFYGILALLSSTLGLIKEFSENNKVLILFLIGLVWTVSTVTVPMTMSARTAVEQSLSCHFTRLVLLGITLHMLFNISLMLPSNIWATSNINVWSVVAVVFLVTFATIAHVLLWIQGSVYGEVDRNPRREDANNTGSS